MTLEELKNIMGREVCVTLIFYKKDKSLRVMHCNRNFKFDEDNEDFTDYIPPNGRGLKYDNTKRGLLTVYDIENKGFRQVRARNVLNVLI